MGRLGLLSHVCSRLASSLLILVLALPGERPPADPRFATPVRAVCAFWNAVRDRSAAEALECFSGGFRRSAAARALRLPMLDRLDIRNARVERQGTGRAVVRYEVHYRVRDNRRPGAFQAADELVRVRGQWRILRPLSASPGARRPAVPATPRVHVAPGPEFV